MERHRNSCDDCNLCGIVSALGIFRCDREQLRIWIMGELHGRAEQEVDAGCGSLAGSASTMFNQ